MGSTLADERGTTIPGRHLKDRHTAPRLQVIGFDLSAGKSGRALDSDDDDGFGVNCMHPYSSVSSTPMNTNINTDISPRSALQQLLLPHSDAVPALPAHNTVSHGPSFLAPAAKQMTVEMAALTSKPCTMVGRIPTVPVNWPTPKGIAELITGPSLHSTSIHDRHRDCSPAMAVGKVHSAMRIGSRSCQPVISARSDENERNWDDANNRLPEESKKSIGMEADKSKKTSLFILAASSPITKYGNQCFHGDGADQYESPGVDMEFLNSCHLCKRFLGHGHDIFMYSRNKAFCSMECRYQQMLMDERKERRTPLVIRAGASPAYRSYMASPTGNVIIDQTGATTPISIS